MDRRTAKRISTGILLTGLLAAAVIFFVMPEPVDDPMGNDPLAQKKYLQQMERIGGKANVLSAEIRDWFDGLRQGRRLAGTVAVTTVVVAWGFWFFVTMPPLEEPRRRDQEPPPAG